VATRTQEHKMRAVQTARNDKVTSSAMPRNWQKLVKPIIVGFLVCSMFFFGFMAWAVSPNAELPQIEGAREVNAPAPEERWERCGTEIGSTCSAVELKAPVRQDGA
jgi:hypothetical protein